MVVQCQVLELESRILMGHLDTMLIHLSVFLSCMFCGCRWFRNNKSGKRHIAQAVFCGDACREVASLRHRPSSIPRRVYATRAESLPPHTSRPFALLHKLYRVMQNLFKRVSIIQIQSTLKM